MSAPFIGWTGIRDGEIVSIKHDWDQAHPGETCPTCKRKVPHPKKESSPRDTATASYRAPKELRDELEQRLDELGKFAGLDSLPYAKARTINLLLTLAEAIDRETLQAVAEGMSWGTATTA